MSANWLLAVTGLVGLAVGSFLNVVIYRLPIMLERRWREDGDAPGHEDTYNLIVPASACPACGRKIRPLENIPLLSWLALRGRCAGCKARISPRYPVVELLAAVLSILAVWHFGPTLAGAGALLLVWTLIAAAAIDLDHYILPDILVLPLLWLGLLFNLSATFAPLSEAVIGAVAGYLVLWIIYQVFRLTTGKEGLGYGDFKLLACLGAWLGWRELPLIILAGALAGVLIGGTWLLVSRRDRSHPVPFGPFLVAGGLLALFAGPAIEHAYLAWILH
ncbi:MAG: A24 family peptidase [Gammaproteobacteria bacterium]|nr:A24 family peptidase [Gammaproteobacteria bacterium]